MFDAQQIPGEAEKSHKMGRSMTGTDLWHLVTCQNTINCFRLGTSQPNCDVLTQTMTHHLLCLPTHLSQNLTLFKQTNRGHKGHEVTVMTVV